MARTLVASDAFTESSETNLESHNTGNWTECTTRGSGYVKCAASSANYIFCKFTPGQDVVYRWSGSGSFTGDNYVKAAISAIGTNFEWSGVALFASTDTGANRDYYLLYVRDTAGSGGSNPIKLDRVNNGSATNLYSANQTFTSGDTLELEAIVGGSSVTLRMYKNGSQFGGDITDSNASRLTSGAPGLYLNSSSAGHRISAWEAGTVASGPTLSSPTGTTTGSTTATVGATTDTGSGTLYAVVSTSASVPTAAQIKAGNDASGSAAKWSGSVSVSSTGAKTLSATGLNAATAYYAHLVHSTTGDSNVVSSSSFTTTAIQLSGSFTLDDFTFAGTLASVPASTLLGTITLDDLALSGFLGQAPGRVDTAPFKNWSGTLLPGITVPNVVFLKLDRSTALSLSNQTTAGDGVLTIENASLVSGTYYIMVSYSADGSSVGAELVLAT